MWLLVLWALVTKPSVSLTSETNAFLLQGISVEKKEYKIYLASNSCFYFLNRAYNSQYLDDQLGESD